MSIYDAIKDGVKVARNAGNIELSIELAKVADDILDKQHKIEELDSVVRELKDKFEIKEELLHQNSAYWRPLDDTIVGPYCTRCWDVKRVLVRLNTGHIPFECPECKNFYRDAEEIYED
jgi:hypothetical protein